MNNSRSHLTIASRVLRSGVTLIEVLAGIALISALGVVIVPGLSRISQSQAVLDEKETALRELANLAELAWAHGSLEHCELSSSVRERLPDVQLRIDTGEIDPVTGLRPATFSLAWTTEFRQPGTPLQLTVWLPERKES